MWYPSLLRVLIPGSGGGGIHCRAARREPAACRLHLEHLEDRWCPSYTITDLGTFGGRQSYAYAINSLNEVIGQAEVASGPNHAFFYNGSMTDLGTESGDVYSRATAINDSHQVVGLSGSGVNNEVSHAVMWLSIGPPPTDMGNIGSTSNTTARAINNAGQVVGDGYTAAGVDHAWLGQFGTIGLTDLNNEPGVVGSGWVLTQAWGINDNQQITGYGTINGLTHAFLWLVNSGVAPTDLGALIPGAASYGTAINSNGQVAGYGNNATVIANGFFWTSTDGMTDLPPLRKDLTSYAYALNDLSAPQVVGASNSGAFFHAVLWQNGKVTDLTSLLPKGSVPLHYAYGINDGGSIVGISGQLHAFLVTPTGTPSAPVAALPSGAILSSSSIAPSSPVLAPAPFLVSATVPDPAPTGWQNQSPPFSVATSDRGGPNMLSASRTVHSDRLALEVRDRVFAAFADELAFA
jgi:probable HAF family extracellular repeat protein